MRMPLLPRHELCAHGVEAAHAFRTFAAKGDKKPLGELTCQKNSGSVVEEKRDKVPCFH